jgi:hypothetical protein
MPDAPASEMNSARTTVIPRGVKDGKLMFYVIFNFDIRNNSETWRFLKDWPAAVARLKLDAFITGHGSSTVNCREEFPESSSPHNSEKHKIGLNYSDDDLAAASTAWKAIFTSITRPLTALETLASPRPSGLKSLAEKEGSNLKNKLASNPEAASDLRPVHRFEQPARADLKNTNQAMQALSLMRKSPDDDASIQTAKVLIEGSYLRLNAVMPETAVSAPSARALIESGTPEIVRLRRMVNASRNRGGGESETARPAPMTADTPTVDVVPWGEFFGSVSQFPGLMRRLKLAIYCSIPKPPSLQDGEGTIAVKCTVDDVEFQSNVTKFSLAGQGFRPAASKTAPDLLVDKNDYEISQYDYTAWAATLNAASGENLEAVSQVRRTEFIGIYRNDQRESMEAKHINNRLSQAGDLNAKFQQMAVVADKLQRIDILGGPTPEPGIKNGLLNTFKSLQQKTAERPLDFASLSRGVTVDVRRQLNGAEWSPLCMREVSLLKTGTDTKPLLTWIEEAVIPNSPSETPAPMVGEVVAPPKDSGRLRIKIFGAPLQKDDGSVILRYASATPREFTIWDDDDLFPTQVNSLVGRISTVSDILQGDIVQVTAEADPSGPVATKVYLYPVLKTLTLQDLDFDPAAENDKIVVLRAWRLFGPTNSKRFPILLHQRKAVTRFLDSSGLKTITDQIEAQKGAENGFTVEGSRRFASPHAGLLEMRVITKNANIKDNPVFAESLPTTRISVNHISLDQQDQLRLLPIEEKKSGWENAIRVDKSSRLELFRGFVETIFLEFGGKLKNEDKIEGIEIDLNFPSAPKPPESGKVRIIKGLAVYDDTGKWKVQSWTESEDLDPNKNEKAEWTEEERALNEKSEIGWRVVLREPAGVVRNIFFPSSANFKSDNVLFVDLSVKRLLVECIAVRRGKRLIGRHQPRGVFGTLRGTPEQPRLFMPDGTSIQLGKLTVAQRIPWTSYFTIKGTANLPVLESPVATKEDFRIAGEVLNLTPSSATHVLLAIRALGGEKTWSVRASKEVYIQELADRKFTRRIVDLEVGDFIFLDTHVLEDGTLEANPADIRTNGVMVLGKGLWPDANETSLVREGTDSLIPVDLVTEAGVKRIVWVAKAAKPVSGEWVALAMPVIDAKTITLIDPPGSRLNPGAEEEKKGSGIEPVTASLSDAIARWSGWSLVVPEPGEADKTEDERKNKAGQNPFTFKITIPKPKKFRLPRLRYGQSYDFRLRKADLAANHHLDEGLKEAIEAQWFSSLQDNPHNLNDKVFQRPAEEPGPVIVASQSDGGKIMVPLPKDETSQDKNSAPKSTAHPRLIFVSDPLSDPSGNAGVAIGSGNLWLLPPDCAISTIIKSGMLDQVSSPESLFKQHEKHFEDETYIHEHGKLNYFPDPLIYPEFKTELRDGKPARINVNAHEAAVADESGKVFQPLDDQSEPKDAAAAAIDLSGGKQWPKCSPVEALLRSAEIPKVKSKGQSVAFHLPPSWTGRGQVRRNANKNVWTDFQLIHATSSPRTRPQWVSLVDDFTRSVNETSDRFQGVIQVHPRSTGAIALTAYWNEYWDEKSPLHFVEARVGRDIHEGRFQRLRVDSEGSGYATAWRVAFEGSGNWREKNDLAHLVDVKLENGKVVSLRGQGGSNLPDDFRIRILRRPPLTSFAKGEVILRKDGQITEVKITEPGGFYAQPPLVVFHDLEGDGHGAKGLAVLDDNGGVIRVRFETAGKGEEQRGTGYSPSTIVAFYTHSKALQEIHIEAPGVPDRDEYLAEQNHRAFTVDHPIQFEQAFDDTKARETYYAAIGSTRFRELLDQVQSKGSPAPRPRVSAPQRLEVRATARPPRPEWHHHAYAYKWTSQPDNLWPFRMTSGDSELIIRREGAVRCYLRRGWNATGRELLGVVVMNSEVNTTRTSEAPGSIIPKGMRGLVSRWGYDPVWDDTAVPPLTLDDFTKQVAFVPYENIIEYTGEDERFVGLALHEVEYDPEKELYYADIGIRNPPASLPFIQLALVRYQPLAIDGQALSEVLLTDPIRVPGDRKLKIQRNLISPHRFNVALEGPFPPTDNSVGKNPNQIIPRREIVVELRRRDPNLAAEIEGPLANEISSGTAGASSNGPDEFLLEPSEAGGKFAKTVQLAVPRGKEKLYLRVVEREIYATSEPQRDMTGDVAKIVPDSNSKDPSKKRAVADWMPFTCSINIE